MDKKRVKVIIYGEELKLKGSMNLSYMQKIAEFVDLKMKELSKTSPRLNHQKVAVLTCLNLTDELFKLQEDLKELEKMIEES